MKEKLKFEMWKQKINKLYKIKFGVKKQLFKISNILDYQKEGTLNLFKEIVKSICFLILISILILIIEKIEEIVYNNVFVNWDNIKFLVNFSSSSFFEFLIASLGISGVLIALFYANLSGVFSSKYVNLDTELSFEILNEKENKRNIRSIRNYIITNISLIMFYIFGINFKWIVALVFVCYTAKTIIAFINLSQRIFYFTNLNFITKKSCSEIYESYSNLKIDKRNYRDVNFQNLYYNKARNSIEKLYKLLESFIKEKDYNAIYKFEINITNTLCNYMINKNRIPYDSKWFQDKYKQKSMLSMSERELVVYLNTGTIPSPERIKDTNWLEEEFFNLLSIGIKCLIKDDKTIYAYRIIENLDKRISYALKNGNIEEIVKKEMVLFKEVNRAFNYEEKNSFYIQAILEMETLLFTGAILESIKYIKNCQRIIDKLDYRRIGYKKLLKFDLKIFNNEKVVKVSNQLKLEKKIEGKIITDGKYIKEFLYALLFEQINNIANSYVEILDFTSQIAEEMYNQTKYNEVKIILAKNIEIYNKMENSYNGLETINQEIIKSKKDFIWIDEMPKNLRNKIRKCKIRNIILSINLLSKLKFEQKNIDESELDLFGLVFYNAYLIANELLNDEDIENFKKVYNHLFGLSIITEIRIKEEIRFNGYNESYAINKYIKPYIYFMDMQGRMIYFSRISNNGNWEELVKEQTEKITKKEVWNTFVTYGMIDRKSLNFDTVRDSLDRNFINTVLKKAQIKDTEDFYNRKEIISDDEIIKKFKLGRYNFSEIYLCYYANDKVDNKFIGKFNWNKGGNE